MNEFLGEINKREFQRKFNIEKSIEGTEAFEVNKDIMKGVDESEILEKARTGYYKDNAYNRKHGLVGKKYKKDPKKDETKTPSNKNEQFDYTFFDDYPLSGKERQLILDVKNGKKPLNDLTTIHDDSSNIDQKGRNYLQKFMNKEQPQPSSKKVGDTTEYNGKKYKKQANGKWLEVSKEEGRTRKEHSDAESFHIRHGMQTPGHREAHYKDADKHKEIASKLSDKEHSDEEVGLGKQPSEKKEDSEVSNIGNNYTINSGDNYDFSSKFFGFTEAKFKEIFPNKDPYDYNVTRNVKEILRNVKDDPKEVAKHINDLKISYPNWKGERRENGNIVLTTKDFDGGQRKIILRKK